jgi:hypothetical protein
MKTGHYDELTNKHMLMNREQSAGKGGGNVGEG